ncbi:ribosomal protein S5 domain 2-type protein [Catenaria anguillulae PL171]|uniref:Ribosomal protein S5 domain 2-type protein n=1 Tax=Catenaria anguillulae PL171 TaxID=765915 RepID=A0A1Y2I0E6_9FUNG|nr:ribosomal protein S5 domain 2-type protein [Catenaria anguillulae PL171]
MDSTDAHDQLFHPALSDKALEEVVVLSSIYSPDNFSRLQNSHSTPAAADYKLILPVDDLPDHLHPHLRLTFTPSYPDACPPAVAFAHTPLWSDDMKRTAEARLREVWVDVGRDVACWEWAEWLREYVLEMIGPIAEAMSAAAASAASNHGHGGSSSNGGLADDSIGSGDGQDVNSMPDLALAPTRHIDQLYSHSEPIIDRKSTFIAHAAFISDANRDPKELWDYMLSHRRIARATHNITAYRLVLPHPSGGEVVAQDCDDDGEDAAGKRLLHLLQLVDARNVWVCVSRWYGGIQLGPDRFAHINNAARQVLVNMGVAGDGESSGSTGGKGKKGGKR